MTSKNSLVTLGEEFRENDGDKDLTAVGPKRMKRKEVETVNIGKHF